MLSGCFSPVKYSTDIGQVRAEPYYGDIALTGDVHDRWWEIYGDAELNAFIEQVLADSPTLKIAYLKMVDSALAVRQAESGYYPGVSFSLGAGGGGNVYGEASADPKFNMGLSVGYEIDLWGKVRAQKRMGELSREMAADAADAAAISLTAEVVTEWFNVKYYRAKRELTEQLLKISEDYSDLVESYYRAGQSTGMDVLEQRQQIESLRSTLTQLDGNIRISLRALEILSGGRTRPGVNGALPDGIDVGGTVPPEALLENRPDVRSARRAAQKADAQVIIALADRLPTLKLSASLSYRDSNITEMFARMFWEAAAALAVNLFDGFKKTTAIDRAKTGYMIERLSYGNVVMQAAADVEKALIELDLRNRLLVDTRAQLVRQKEILDVSRGYFIGGTMTYNRVLNALRGLIQASQTELDARRQVLSAQIALFKAMGGSNWVKSARKTGEKSAWEALESLEPPEKTESDSAAETDIESDPGTEAGVESDSAAETDIESNPGTEAGTEPYAAAETDIEPDPGTETGAEPDSAAETDIESDPGTESGIESGAAAEAKP